MRISVLAAIAAASLTPGIASASGHTQHDRRMTVPDVRIHAPRAAHAGTTWRAPAGGPGTREEYRRDEPLYADERYPDEYHDGERPYGEGPYYDDGHAYGVEDYAMSDRFVRDGRGALDYDRDYPYDAPYGRGGGYYTIVETTVTTGPSVVTYAAEKKVAVHRAKRTVKKRRAYRTSARKSVAKTCHC